MTLTTTQIGLIEASFRQMLPISGLATELFFARLLQTAPDIQPRSHSELRADGAEIVQELGSVVATLDDREALAPILRNLAARLVARGVTPAMYGPLGQAMIYTLSHSLGEAFTHEMHDAWEAAYEVVSDEMVRSAYPTAEPETGVAAE
ncbi:MAG: globin domain-containing protein [Pseudomonadota bacterium]